MPIVKANENKWSLKTLQTSTAKYHLNFLLNYDNMNLNNYLGKIEKDDFFVDRETRHLIEEILKKVSLNRSVLYCV